MTHIAFFRSALFPDDFVIREVLRDMSANDFFRFPVGAGDRRRVRLGFDGHARIEIGQRATTSRGIAVEMSGSYDGIGSKGYEAYTAKAQVHLPLQ